jgi:NAD(P)-dependent dehydrogenase (short-subunit alcohol dehydrogenase family)
VKSALVTGGSRGIGLAIARRLAADGYALTLVARSPERLDAAAAELGGDVRTFAADLRDEAAVVEAVARHGEAYGALDVLVNNAGVGLGQPVGELSTSRVDVQLALNLRAPILFYREALPWLTRPERAWVVNVASLAAVAPAPWLSVYSAAKAGLVAFSQAMDAELADRGIRSCALCPGAVDTDLTAYLPGPREALLRDTDVADAVGFLLGLSPAAHVTTITVATNA